MDEIETDKIKITYEPGFIMGDPFEDEIRRRVLILEKRVFDLESNRKKPEETNA